MFEFDVYDEVEVVSETHVNRCYRGVVSNMGTIHFIKESYYNQLLYNEYYMLHRLSELKNVPNVYNYATTNASGQGGTPWYLVMENIEGYTLEELLCEVKITFDEIMSIGYKMLMAINDIHNKGVYHCDLKMSNIIIDNSDNLNLVDFGTACEINSLHKNNLKHDIKKSPYTSSVRDEEIVNIDKRAVGKILYRMLTKCTLEELDCLSVKHAEEVIEQYGINRNLKYVILLCLLENNSTSELELAHLLSNSRTVTFNEYIILKKYILSVDLSAPTREELLVSKEALVADNKSRVQELLDRDSCTCIIG